LPNRAKGSEIMNDLHDAKYITSYRKGWQMHRDGIFWAHQATLELYNAVALYRGWHARKDAVANPFKIVGFTMRVADKVTA
jgi:hypothetical protein